MRSWALVLTAAALGATLLTAPAAAQTNNQRDQVEVILTRAVLERGAFLACARLDSTKETRDLLARGWVEDLMDAGTILRAVGYTDAEIDVLRGRYDIEKAAPQFADLKVLADYCSVVGDWKARWARLQITIPKVELRRVLKP